MPTNFDNTTIRAGSAGQLWANIPIPAAGARIAISAAGEPTAVGAVHLGYSSGGATLNLTGSTEDLFADESPNAVYTISTSSEASVTFSALQVLDMTIMRLLSPYTGTEITGATGVSGMTFGQKNPVYTGIAYIFPVQNSTTQFAVWHLYNAVNTDGISFTVSRSGLSETPATFKGTDVAGRAKTDSLGTYYKQTA